MTAIDLEHADSELEDVLAGVRGARIVLKSTSRALRNALATVTDLEQRLDRLSNRTALGGTAHEQHRDDRPE